jgi:DNA-binding XRE family transcriptional regulator
MFVELHHRSGESCHFHRHVLPSFSIHLPYDTSLIAYGTRARHRGVSASMRERDQIQKLLGRALKEVRATRAITQEELAERSGLHTTYISDIERGARNPSFAALVSLSEGLNATMAEIGAVYDRLAK